LRDNLAFGGIMERLIIKGSFWLGNLFAALALIARGLDTLGINTLNFSTKGSEIGYHTFMNGTFFFYLISIALTTYLGFSTQRRSSLAGEETKRVL
jgi:energy-converting hydrogenase Eha subunit B